MNELIAGNIRAQRARANITQAELAERIGVSRETVISWEKGETSVSLPKAVDVANALNCTVSALVE